MSRPKNIFFLATTLLLTMSVLSTAALHQGDDLPDLTTFQLEGKLPDKLKGQVVLLDFFASWCGPCKSSFPAMEELRKKYESSGLTILAVSIDDKRENMDRFVKSTGIHFAAVRDPKKKLVSAVDIPAMPTSLLIDRAGKIRFIHAGFHGDDTTREYTKEIEQLLQEPTP
jgi:thiol-disulfide isomerase/thioredoxin